MKNQCYVCGTPMEPIGHVMIYDAAFECPACHYKEHWKIDITRTYPKGYTKPKPKECPDPPRLHNFRKVYK